LETVVVPLFLVIAFIKISDALAEPVALIGIIAVVASYWITRLHVGHAFNPVRLGVFEPAGHGVRRRPELPLLANVLSMLVMIVGVIVLLVTRG
jgi:hypothetical protein